LKLKTAVSNSQSDEEEEEEEGEEEDQEEDEEEEDGDSDKNDSDLDADLTDSDESRNSQGGSVTTLNTFRPSRLPPVKERRASISGALTTEAAGERKSAMGVPAAKARRASLSGALSTETIQQTRNAPVRERRGSIIGASVTEHGGDRKPTMCGPPARERRGSISGAVTAEAVEEVQEKMRDVPVIGADGWLVFYHLKMSVLISATVSGMLCPSLRTAYRALLHERLWTQHALLRRQAVKWML